MTWLVLACSVLAPTTALVVVYRSDIAAYWHKIRSITDRVVIELDAEDADIENDVGGADEYKEFARGWYEAGAFAAMNLHTRGGVSEATIEAEFETEWRETPSE